MICVLLSGGIDSTYLLHQMIQKNNKIKCIFFDYQQPVATQEKIAAQKICNHYGIDLLCLPIVEIGTEMNTGIGTKGARVVENRNQTFLCYAHSIYPDADLAMGANANDYDDYADCRPEFFRAMSKTLGVKIYTLCHMSKKEIIKKSRQAKIPIKKTWSCYQADLNNQQCGTCNSCIERKINTNYLYDFLSTKKSRLINKIYTSKYYKIISK